MNSSMQQYEIIGKNNYTMSDIFRDEDPTFFSLDPDPAQLVKKSGSGKVDLINQHFKLDFVNSSLCFV